MKKTYLKKMMMMKRKKRRERKEKKKKIPHHQPFFLLPEKLTFLSFPLLFPYPHFQFGDFSFSLLHQQEWRFSQLVLL